MRAAWMAMAGLALGGNAALAADLPDFTELVQAHSASVVNISSERRAEEQSRRPEELDEFFRRFFPAPAFRRPTRRGSPRAPGSSSRATGTY